MQDFKFVDHFLNPCAKRVKTYLRDTTHFLTSLEGIHDLPAGTLLCFSAHPKTCIESIPYIQYLQIRCICGTLSDYDRHMKDMTIHFLDRGFPIDLLHESALKARRLKRFDLLHPPPPRTKNITVAALSC